MTFKKTFVIGVLLIFFHSAFSEAQISYGIAKNSYGEIIFTDAANGRIMMILPDSTLAVLDSNKISRQIWIDKNDRVYFTDHIMSSDSTSFDMLFEFTRGGKKRSLITPQKRESFNANAFAVTENGKIYFADKTRIFRLASNGNKIPIAGGSSGHADGNSGNAAFQNINAMTLGPDGNFYVTDAANIRKVTPEGKVSTVVSNLTGDPSQFLSINDPSSQTKNLLLGIAVSPDLNIYTAGFMNGIVLKISPAGSVETFYKSEPGWFPAGVTVDENLLYVMEVQTGEYDVVTATRVLSVNKEGEENIIIEIDQ